MGKGGFQFAHAPLVPGLMAELARGPLARYTPCRPAPDAQLAAALAEVHAELILVHPFREGNGRIARLLAVLMGLQAGLPPLDFSLWNDEATRVTLLAFTQSSIVTTRHWQKCSCGLSPGLGSAPLPVVDERGGGGRLQRNRPGSERLAYAFDGGGCLGGYP